MNEKDFNFLKENYSKQDFNLNFLMKMVGEVLNEKVDLSAATVTPDEDIDISLPTIRITEAWGRKGNDDRQIIESFTKRIEGTTLAEKLGRINAVLTGEGIANVSELLSSMVVVEILSTILSDFTESAGGFIFEGFLAGLFGGESVQITSPEEIEGMDASGKPITDVVLNNVHYSLKLLGEKTAVAGSFRNMVEHFDTLDHVVYLDARRIEGNQGLEFGEFTITLDNFLDVFVTPFLKSVNVKGIEFATAKKFKEAVAELQSQKKPVTGLRFGKAGFNNFQYKVALYSKKLDEAAVSTDTLQGLLSAIAAADESELEQYGPFTLSYRDTRFEGTKAEKLFGSIAVVDILRRNIEAGNKQEIINSLRETAGYKNEEQFIFTRRQAEDIAGFKTIGTLMIGEKTMKGVWMKYAKILQEVINPIYSNLQEFTNNVNAYLLGAGDANRKSRGMQAVSDAKQLGVATTKAIEAVSPEENV
tara:strand:- start:77 stop:1501 length:1425 start_codon:yes stop_codon:yes gene_type:complete